MYKQNKSISIDFKAIKGELAFLEELLIRYNRYKYGLIDNEALTEQQFKLSIEDYMDLSDYSKSYLKLFLKRSEDAQIKRVLLLIDLEKEISKWIEYNLKCLNETLVDYSFYLKEKVKIERSKLIFNKLHVKISFSIDIK